MPYKVREGKKHKNTKRIRPGNKKLLKGEFSSILIGILIADPLGARSNI